VTVKVYYEAIVFYPGVSLFELRKMTKK